MQNQRQVKRILCFALDIILFFADNTTYSLKAMTEESMSAKAAREVRTQAETLTR